MDGIFISYRREDSAGYAGRLYDRLAAHFGSERVFMDVEGIDPGTDFVDAIERAVGSCKVLIVLIGKQWSAITDEKGCRRLEDPHDFIRLETGTALKRDIRVVPVLVEGAQMPRADELPEELVALTRRQAIEISHKQWEASTGNLLEALDRIYQPQPDGEEPETGISGEDGKGSTGRRYAGVLLGVALVAALAGAGWLASRWLLPLEPQVVGPLMPQTRIAEEPRNDLESDRVTATDPTPPATTVTILGNGADPEKNSVEDRLTGALVEVIPEPASEETPEQTPEKIQPADAEAPVATVIPEMPVVPGPQESTAESGSAPPMETDAAEPVAKPQSEHEPEVSAKPPAEAAPIPKPIPPPRIFEFTASVNGDRVELCYRVADTQRLVLSPKPGRLENRRADCVGLALAEQTRFRLLASNGDQQAEASLLVTPEPVPEPEPPAQGPLPAPGDYWTYRVTGRWASSAKRTIRISTVAVDNAAVDEVQLQIDGQSQQHLGQRRVTGPMARVLHSPVLGTEFSPYLGAYGGLENGSSWSAIPTPDSNSFWRDWFSKGGIDGTAQVSVPAGSFSATLVEISSARNPSGSPAERETEPVRVNYRIWYAPEVKRYVKMVRNTLAASGQVMDTDTFELLDYRQQ
ncbi:MAG: TIR domain-containing protein [Sedimenticola sp.]|nr:TIR domain-containing protein [Sedimenticola sp.]